MRVRDGEGVVIQISEGDGEGVVIQISEGDG